MGLYLFDAARRRAVHVGRAARLREENRTPTSGVHQRHAPRSATIDELAKSQHAPMQTWGLSRAHRPAARRRACTSQVMEIIDHLGRRGCTSLLVHLHAPHWKANVSDEFVDPLFARARCWRGTSSTAGGPRPDTSSAHGRGAEPFPRSTSIASATPRRSSRWTSGETAVGQTRASPASLHAINTAAWGSRASSRTSHRQHRA